MLSSLGHGIVVTFYKLSAPGFKAGTVQGHIDMVTEKNNEVEHDFFKDGIRLQRNGDWLKVRLDK